MILVASPSANSCSALVASVVSSSRFRLKPEPALCVLSRVFNPLERTNNAVGAAAPSRVRDRRAWPKE